MAETGARSKSTLTPGHSVNSPIPDLEINKALRPWGSEGVVGFSMSVWTSFFEERGWVFYLSHGLVPEESLLHQTTKCK
jgi:hypothetical protein